jgi:hypothetical protein
MIKIDPVSHPIFRINNNDFRQRESLLKTKPFKDSKNAWAQALSQKQTSLKEVLSEEELTPSDYRRIQSELDTALALLKSQYDAALAIAENSNQIRERLNITNPGCGLDEEVDFIFEDISNFTEDTYTDAKSIGNNISKMYDDVQLLKEKIYLIAEENDKHVLSEEEEAFASKGSSTQKEKRKKKIEEPEYDDTMPF